jgi:hypothetical protein
VLVIPVAGGWLWHVTWGLLVNIPPTKFQHCPERQHCSSLLGCKGCSPDCFLDDSSCVCVFTHVLTVLCCRQDAETLCAACVLCVVCCRDPANRLRMMAVPYGSGRGRTAASNYTTLQVVAGGGAAVVQWKLETGRTHQIR